MVWIPFGFFAVVTSSTAGPLLMLNMHWVNSKLILRDAQLSGFESAVGVLDNFVRLLENHEADSSGRSPWSSSTGLQAFRSWCEDRVAHLEHMFPADTQPALENALAQQLAQQQLVPAEADPALPATPQLPPAASPETVASTLPQAQPVGPSDAIGETPAEGGLREQSPSAGTPKGLGISSAEDEEAEDGKEAAEEVADAETGAEAS